jgi:hypothetical protein
MDKFVSDTEAPAGDNMCCGRHVEMLDRIRDLLRPPTLRPLLLVIPFFFFVHFSGLTSIRPFMVHVFEEYQMPVSGEWATVITHFLSYPLLLALSVMGPVGCGRDRLCGLVVRVLGYRSGGPGFDSRHYQERKVVGLERVSTQPREYN